MNDINKPGPWRIDPGRSYSSLSRPFWTICRYFPGAPFNTQTVLTRSGAKRFYSEAKAAAYLEKLARDEARQVAQPTKARSDDGSPLKRAHGQMKKDTHDF